MKKQQILLDMDGVLSDFLSGAIESLNRDFNKHVTIDDYASNFGKWETYDYFGITEKEFWESIHSTPDFWYKLKPMTFGEKILGLLEQIGDVTIVTSPSLDPSCAMQKLQWLDNYFGIKSNQVFIGGRKYLMAGNGLLFDDYYKNVNSFIEAGGKAVLLPSNWNTVDLQWEELKETILTGYDNARLRNQRLWSESLL